MTNRPIRFVSLDTVLGLHRIAIADQGGNPSVRDLGLLESALAQPQAQFGGQYLHEDLPSMAAAYCFHICTNHPFVDGNKRASLAAMLAFLVENGARLNASPEEVERIVVDTAAGSLDKKALTQWVRSRCINLSAPPGGEAPQ